ncbi:hypothetical protein NSQ26_14210 [Bacillus sp. FSL W7-1360]
MNKKRTVRFTKVASACLLSTALLFAPTTSFAATDAPGTLFRDGVEVDLSAQLNDSTYYPQPDKDPYKEPAQYVTVQTKTAPMTATDMIELNTNGTNALKLKNGVLYIDIDGSGLAPMGNPQAQAYKELGFTDDVLDGTEFKQEIRWKRIYNRLQPRSTQHQWTLTETHGVSTANTKEFAYSVGAEVGATLDGVTGKISGNISQKFSTTTTITNQTTNTVTDTFPAKPASYPYDDYRVAIYQKEEVYTVVPGEKLTRAMANLAEKLNTSTANVYPTSFTYTTGELRPIVTLDQP